MYNLLVVDDEDIAIRGITQGIDWTDMPIAELFTAYDAEEAKEILLNHRVDILLSDIDMPNENGLELLRWVNEHRSDTVTLFLTGHAEFNYAQQAVQLDCFDYLLKPIDHRELKRCIASAIEKVKEQNELAEVRGTYRIYSEQWRRQRPFLVERFWQDLLHYRLSVSPHQIEPMMATYEIPLQASSSIRIILISIEQWREEWSARDEEIMTYAVKNAAAEILLDGRGGVVVQEASGILYVIGYEPDAEDESEITNRCKHFIAQCRGMLHGQLSCYVGEPVTLQEARGKLAKLLEQEKYNVNRGGSVLHEREFARTGGEAAQHSFPFTDWSVLLTSGKQTELAYRIDECFDRMQEQKADYTLLASFYFGFMNMLFGWLHQRSLQVADVFRNGEWEDGLQAMKSLSRLRAWTHQISLTASSYAMEKGKSMSQAVEKVRRYMQEHLHEEFSREQAAAAVYLNPAYLSRLFRKETGRSLTDYLVELRIAKARDELANTNHRISDIALSVGYSNFSHFSQLYKKMTGLTPQEYRKKHMDI